jgi:hypothetical protein
MSLKEQLAEYRAGWYRRVRDCADPFDVLKVLTKKAVAA